MIRLRRYLFYLGISFEIGILIILILLGLDYFFPPNLARFQNVSKELRTESEQLIHVFQTKDEKWRLGVRLKDIDPLYINMLIAREDRYFWNHWGVNPLSLMRSLYQYLSRGKVISGGSTLTMQAARLLNPRPRTVIAKLLQILRALQLERRYAKEEILEIYLTLAPYGSNIEGVRSAAFAYFGKPPTHLLPSEAALLVALPQKPKLWTSKGFLASTKKARNKVLSLAFQKGILEQKTYQIALKEPLPHFRFSFPREVPHMARRLCSTPQASTISYCSINSALQKCIESIVREAVNLLPTGVNIAIIMVHHPSHKVMSYVGSANFFDSSRQGQVDFVRAYRSPGSTLKPFIYGLGFDYGFLNPSSYVLDNRQRFGSYLPDNFDKTFHGMVTVTEALAMSLNIPVIELLNKIGPQRFLGALEEAGIKPKFPDPQSSPGLSLALGGMGMTLEQLVTLYAGLAQQGKIIPLKIKSNKLVHQPYQFLSPRSAEYLTQILFQSPPGEIEEGNAAIAVKTGTSYGHRDAWALGYNAEYVVGIWIGRPDGAPFGMETGRTLAVPLLQKVFMVSSALQPRHRMIQQGKGLQSHEVSTLKKNNLYKGILKMLFPVDATIIEIFKDDKPKLIMLSASGGKRPYTWLVDGAPIATNVWSPKISWKPEKPGFYRICLLDAQGVSKAANIEVQ